MNHAVSVTVSSRWTSIHRSLGCLLAWYPNAIELTALLLPQTQHIKGKGRVTSDTVERGSDHIARHVVHDHRPAGAFDPYLRAPPPATARANRGKSDYRAARRPASHRCPSAPDQGQPYRNLRQLI
jgi:hypothetical protein